MRSEKIALVAIFKQIKCVAQIMKQVTKRIQDKSVKLLPEGPRPVWSSCNINS
jgi:hypothetical protein